MGAGEALAKQKGGKRGAVDLKQSLQIALRHADMRRDGADRNVPAADIFHGMDLCRSQSGRAYPAAFWNVRVFTVRSERKHHQIVHMGRSTMPKRRRHLPAIVVQQLVRIACQKIERGCPPPDMCCMMASSTSTTIRDNVAYGIRMAMDSPKERRSNTTVSPLLINTASF